MFARMFFKFKSFLNNRELRKRMRGAIISWTNDIYKIILRQFLG